MRKLIVMALIALGAIFIQPKPSEAGVVVWGWGGCCGYYYQPPTTLTTTGPITATTAIRTTGLTGATLVA